MTKMLPINQMIIFSDSRMFSPEENRHHHRAVQGKGADPDNEMVFQIGKQHVEKLNQVSMMYSRGYGGEIGLFNSFASGSRRNIKQREPITSRLMGVVKKTDSSLLTEQRRRFPVQDHPGEAVLRKKSFGFLCRIRSRLYKMAMDITTTPISIPTTRVML
jgi:hypothetical protein